MTSLQFVGLLMISLGVMLVSAEPIVDAMIGRE